MKKCIILLLLTQTIFSLQSMKLSNNDIIKGEASARYAQQAIEIHETLLTIYKSNPDNDSKNILKSTFEIIPNSIRTMRLCPQSTYGLLQEGSKTWHQIKEMFHGPFWGNIKEQHEKLNNLYLLASNNAYKKIGESYSSTTQKLFAQLWSSSLTILQEDHNFPKDLAAAQLFVIAKSFYDIQQSPSNTYPALQDMETMKWFSYGSQQIKNSKHREQRNTALKQLKEHHDEIKAPGMLN